MMKKSYQRGASKRRHKMSYSARQELLRSVAKRYLSAGRKEKAVILDEVCKSTGLHRKHVIRALNNFVEEPSGKEKRGRKRTYDDPNLIVLLKTLRAGVGNVCAELFHQQISSAIDLYERHIGKIPEEQRALLKRISVSTLKRILPGAYKAKSGVRKHYRQASKLCGKVPLQINYPKPQDPGCLEIDLVEHNGGDPSGQYLYTFTAIDKVTNWVIRTCMPNKSAISVHRAMDFAVEKLPYSLFWIDTDNGSEFLNDLIIKWTDIHDYLFTRSRAGKKNDNAHVERANKVYVRELIGYSRFTSQKACKLINRIYLLDELHVNFFVPGRKIVRKIYDNTSGKRIKLYDKARTPYNRVIAFYGNNEQLSEKICKPLQNVYQTLNPWELVAERDKLMLQLGRLKR
jgi:hypothetical protein